MKNSKKFILLLFLISLLFSCGNDDSQNENTAATTSNTTASKQENNSENTETKKQSENNVQGTRYGNDTVGYVTKPENWLEFTDPNSSTTAVQLSLDSVNIVTLDLISKDGKANADKAAYVLMQKHINEGVPKENISLDPANINGYKGVTLSVKMNDGTIFIVTFIDHDGKVYFLSMEGLPNKKTLEEMASVVETWKPTK